MRVKWWMAMLEAQPTATMAAGLRPGHPAGAAAIQLTPCPARGRAASGHRLDGSTRLWDCPAMILIADRKRRAGLHHAGEAHGPEGR